MAAGRAIVRCGAIPSRHLETPLVALGTEIHRGLVRVVATIAGQLALVRCVRIGRAAIIGFLGQIRIAAVTAQASGSRDRRRGRTLLVTGGTVQSRCRMQRIERAAMNATRRHRRCRRGTRRVRRRVCRPGGHQHGGAKQQHGRDQQTGKTCHQPTRPPQLDGFDPLVSQRVRHRRSARGHQHNVSPPHRFLRGAAGYSPTHLQPLLSSTT